MGISCTYYILPQSSALANKYSVFLLYHKILVPNCHAVISLFWQKFYTMYQVIKYNGKYFSVLIEILSCATKYNCTNKHPHAIPVQVAAVLGSSCKHRPHPPVLCPCASSHAKQMPPRNNTAWGRSHTSTWWNGSWRYVQSHHPSIYSELGKQDSPWSGNDKQIHNKGLQLESNLNSLLRWLNASSVGAAWDHRTDKVHRTRDTRGTYGSNLICGLSIGAHWVLVWSQRMQSRVCSGGLRCVVLRDGWSLLADLLEVLVGDKRGTWPAARGICLIIIILNKEWLEIEITYAYYVGSVVVPFQMFFHFWTTRFSDQTQGTLPNVHRICSGCLFNDINLLGGGDKRILLCLSLVDAFLRWLKCIIKCVWNNE